MERPFPRRRRDAPSGAGIEPHHPVVQRVAEAGDREGRAEPAAERRREGDGEPGPVHGVQVGGAVPVGSGGGGRRPGGRRLPPGVGSARFGDSRPVRGDSLAAGGQVLRVEQRLPGAGGAGRIAEVAEAVAVGQPQGLRRQVEEPDLRSRVAGRAGLRERRQVGEDRRQCRASRGPRQGPQAPAPVGELERFDFPDCRNAEVGFPEDAAGGADALREPLSEVPGVERLRPLLRQPPERAGQIGQMPAVLRPGGDERRAALPGVERERIGAAGEPPVAGGGVEDEHPVGDESLLGERDRRFGDPGERQRTEPLVEADEHRRRRRGADGERPGLRPVAPGRGEPVEPAPDALERFEHRLRGALRAADAAFERRRSTAPRIEHHRVGRAAEPAHRRFHDPRRERRRHRRVRGVPPGGEDPGSGAGRRPGHGGDRAEVAGRSRAARQRDLLDERASHDQARRPASAFPPQSGVTPERPRKPSGAWSSAFSPAARIPARARAVGRGLAVSAPRSPGAARGG